jgi:hypothetical protein
MSTSVAAAADFVYISQAICHRTKSNNFFNKMDSSAGGTVLAITNDVSFGLVQLILV